MEQLTLNWQQSSIQQIELARCKAAISPLIRAFFQARAIGSQFHMAELTEYVRRLVPTAPDSAGRILRDMRQAGELNYSVVDRRKSLYQIEEVA